MASEPMDIANDDHGAVREDEEEEKEEQEEDYGVTFRSYVPKDDKLRGRMRAPAAVPDMVREIGERVKEVTQISMETDVLALAPKKAAWDLARDLEDKRELLDRMTEQAIVGMVREKLQAGGTNNNNNNNLIGQ